MRFFLLSMLFVLSACATPEPFAEKPVTTEKAELRLAPVDFSALPGWNKDDFSQALPALQKSCARILKGAADKKFGPLPQAGTNANWQVPCRALLTAKGSAAIKQTLEAYFRPYEVRANDDPQGLFTGYYEAALKGSKTKHGAYQTPLYARPDDLVMVNLGEFREELKGQRIAGRVVDGNLKPYEDRAAIVSGAWPHNDRVLVYVDDAVDAFCVQVQGSGVVQMDDGSVLRIGYAGQNGHVYYAVGKELVKRGYMAKEDVSLQSIRAWLEAHPAQADEILNTNKSYVFFKTLDGEGPIGGEGVALTPQRSLAIDRSLLPYGIPVWVNIESPVPGAASLQKLMVAQDTGGAITGPVRGDVFWGYGPQAEAMAGPMKSKGQYWVLLPR